MAAKRAERIPQSLRLSLEDRTEELIERKFKPILPLREEEAEHHDYNYPVDIYTKWRGKYFYICVKYRNQREDEFFEVLTTRLEYAGGRQFHLAYSRPTGQWQEVYHARTMEECVETIEREEIFWPFA